MQEKNIDWSDINKQDCEESSFEDMCSWGEAN